MKYLFLLIYLGGFKMAYCQKILELNYRSVFGKEKTFQLFNNSILDYKLKGRILYQSKKMVNMNDSLLMFDNDAVVHINRIKAIRIKGTKISHWVVVAGALFFIGDTGNNILNGHPRIVNEQAVVASSLLLAAGVIIKRIEDKHVYLGKKSTTIRILDLNYNAINK